MLYHDLSALEETCERPDGFELSAYWHEWSRAFEESRPRVEVTVRGPKGVRAMTFESLSEAQRELLRFGTELEVLEPVELRTRIAETAREVAALYVP